MSVLYIVVPLAMAIVAVAVAAYIWATRSGQLDDLDTPALRMLHDDAGGGRAPGTAPVTRRGADQAVGPK
ncbi:MAG: cbb3-type cytochrome oxidase assembly protein CcoS [Gemmatimonadaceae bacterium]